MNLLDVCRGAQRIGISGHVRPDGDCVGSCLALYLYLKRNLPESFVEVQLERPADIFAELSGFPDIDSSFSPREPYDVYFALDCGADRLGGAEDAYASAALRVNIDHHISNSGSGDLNLVRPEVGSTCEVLYDLMDKSLLDRDTAMALYIGIIHDTGVFQYSNTTPETLKRAAHLIGFGFDFPRLIQETFYQRSYVQTKVTGKVMEESRLLLEGMCAVGVADRTLMETCGATAKDLDGIVNQLRNIRGVHCAVFLYETGEDEFKVSLRTDERVDAARITAVFGGGGHMRAAGCTVKGSSEEILEQVLELVEKQLAGTWRRG